MKHMLTLAASVALVAGDPYLINDFERNVILTEHNNMRTKWGACPLEWDESLVQKNSVFMTACVRGRTVSGQSIADTTYSVKPSVFDLVNVWVQEEPHYKVLQKPLYGAHFNSKGFTQMIWKSSMKIGCAMCHKPQSKTAYLECFYEEKGNRQEWGTDETFENRLGNEGDQGKNCPTPVVASGISNPVVVDPCLAGPNGTPCTAQGVPGQCYGNVCHISKALSGCQAHGTKSACSADTACDWQTNQPSFCDKTGCPGVNCATLSPEMKNEGLSCPDCVIHDGHMLCGSVAVAPTTGLCQSKSDPVFIPPHMWEPPAGFWNDAIATINSERASRGQCSLKWDGDLSRECKNDALVAEKCVFDKSGPIADYSTETWYTVPFNFNVQTEVVNFLAEYGGGPTNLNPVSQAIAMLADDAEKVACCICNREIVGQSVISIMTCKVRKAGGVAPVETDIVSDIGSTQQVCAGDVCRASVTHDGKQLAPVAIASSDLVKTHQMAMDIGHVKDFAHVVMGGAPDGHIFRVKDDALVSGEDLTFDCPSSCSKECEVYVVAYHCPSCPKSMKNKVVADALSNGWEMSSCAPELYVTGDDRPQPMVSMRKVLQPGQQHTFSSSGDVTNMFVMSFNRDVADCTVLKSADCEATDGCTMHNTQCVAEEWCPKRFSRGPFQARSGPGCSAACI
eukprot:TRINITY_DN4700_c0_g3_i1.p1 TRINITY_DN4700_c0_g3~~TRINITY_DN4700_c0_g3_i1.p1  ORF type:complete len:679 (+),score=171.04 TRINITY_DN4700_c0_g3_i1:52-2088(+)